MRYSADNARRRAANVLADRNPKLVDEHLEAAAEFRRRVDLVTGNCTALDMDRLARGYALIARLRIESAERDAELYVRLAEGDDITDLEARVIRPPGPLADVVNLADARLERELAHTAKVLTHPGFQKIERRADCVVVHIDRGAGFMPVAAGGSTLADALTEAVEQLESPPIPTTRLPGVA